VHHPLFLQVQSPVWPKAFSTFEVYASTTLPMQATASEAITHFQAQLQNFTTGPQVLPGIEISYQDPMGRLHSLKTSSMTVSIQTVPPDPKAKGDIRGIRGVVGPVGWSPWWWLLLVLAMGIVGLLLWKKRAQKIQGPPPPPPEPADSKALRRLQELLALGWIDAGKIKEFYSGMSDIVRTYLEEAFKTPALEHTTGEILRQLRKKNVLSSEQQVELQKFLESSDLVKFAKFLPDAAEALQDHATAVRFVEMTRRPESGKTG